MANCRKLHESPVVCKNNASKDQNEYGSTWHIQKLVHLGPNALADINLWVTIYILLKMSFWYFWKYQKDIYSKGIIQTEPLKKSNERIVITNKERTNTKSTAQTKTIPSKKKQFLVKTSPTKQRSQWSPTSPPITVKDILKILSPLKTEPANQNLKIQSDQIPLPNRFDKLEVVEIQKLQGTKPPNSKLRKFKSQSHSKLKPEIFSNHVWNKPMELSQNKGKQKWTASANNRPNTDSYLPPRSIP